MGTDVRNNRRRYKYKKKRNRLLIFIGIVATFLAVAGVGAYFYYDYSTRVYDNCVIELGGEVAARKGPVVLPASCKLCILFDGRS